MDDLSPCWVDTSLPLTRAGYARAYWRNPATGRRYTFAHTAMLAKKLGRDIRPGFHAAHRCAVRRCFCPEHLYEATPAENAADKAVARHERGVLWCVWERRPACLHRGKVPAIRALAAEGWSLGRIARHLGLPKSTVAGIVAGRSYRTEVAA